MKRLRGDSTVSFRGPKPKVLIPVKIMQQIRCIVDLVPHEVSFLGTVEQLALLEYRVTEIFLFKQRGNEVRSTLLAQGQLDLMQSLLAQGEGGDEKIEKLRFWAHSHGELPVFVSAIDQSTFATLISDNRPFQIMAVFNRSGDMLADVFVSALGMILHDVPMVVELDPLDESEVNAIKDQIANFVGELPSSVEFENPATSRGTYAS